ncbi:MAG: carbohydrate ABC transporter permease [Bifidobacterium crudilactis]|jgi:lactose/L-arabinose transport system permease protein
MSSIIRSKSDGATRVSEGFGYRSVVLTAVLGIGLVVFIFPFYWLIVASTRKSTDVFSRTPQMLPGTEFFNNVRNLMANTQFGSAFVNSVIVSVVYVICGGIICSLAGYAFAQYRFKGRNVLFALVIGVMALPSQVTLVPLFKMMLTFDWLGSYQALILPDLALPFGIFLMRQAMSSFPASIIEAARIDGAGELRIFGTVVLPTMKPSLAALAIFMFLGRWNDFVYPLVITRTSDQYTLPVALASLQGANSTDYGQLLAGTAISVLPVLILFLFLQKEFVSGMVAGSVKE